MARMPPPEIESDGTDPFVCYADRRIAKRGEPKRRWFKIFAV
jgi:hypothetical protein